MKYYGIKTPGKDSYIWWITDSQFNSWLQFFSIHDKCGEKHPMKFDMGSAIKAYEAVGYKCVELEVSVIREITKEPTVDELLIRNPNLCGAVSILIEACKNSNTPESRLALYDWDSIRGENE